MKGTLPDVWTWPVQTNTEHQHSIKQSFHTHGLPKAAAEGRSHSAECDRLLVRFCDHESCHV